MSERGNKKKLVGEVISNKMDKTIVVEVTRLVKHRVYKKIVRRSTKFKAHDEENKAKEGDRVRIVESRPVSKTKRWKLIEVLEK